MCWSGRECAETSAPEHRHHEDEYQDIVGKGDYEDYKLKLRYRHTGYCLQLSFEMPTPKKYICETKSIKSTKCTLVMKGNFNPSIKFVK